MEDPKEIISPITKFGKYQFRVSLIIILSSFIAPTIVLIMPMMQRSPEFSLIIDNKIIEIANKTDYCLNEYKKQSFEEISRSIFINKTNIDNWASDLKIVCNSNEIFSQLSTVFFIGSIASNFGFSSFADLYGRKKIFVVLNFIMAISLININFLYHYSQLVISSFLLGFSSLVMSIGAVIVNEVIDRDNGGTIMGIANACFPISGIINTFIIFFVGNNRIFLQIVCLMSILNAYLSIFWIKESPKWLISNGKVTKFMKVIRYIIHLNKLKTELNLELKIQNFISKLTIEESNELLEFNSSDYVSNSPSEENLPVHNSNIDNSRKSIDFSIQNQKTYSILDLFTFKSIRMITICLTYLWISSGFSFYGFLLGLSKMTGNIYIDAIVSYSGELIAELLSGYFANLYGKKILMASFLLASVCCIAFSFFSSLLFQIPLLFLSSIGVASAFNLLYIFSTQYYPTNMKSLVMSFFSLANRISAASVPFALNHSQSLVSIIGILSFGSVVSVYFLPDCINYNSGDEIKEISDKIIRVRRNSSRKSTYKSYKSQ